LRRNKLANGIVEFWSLPSVHSLLFDTVPIEWLWDVIGEVTHVAAPSMRVIQEAGERVDVGTASPTPGNDTIVLNRNVVFGVMQRSVRLNDQCEWQLALLQER
jgi:hypothetical protein